MSLREKKLKQMVIIARMLLEGLKLKKVPITYADIKAQNMGLSPIEIARILSLHKNGDPRYFGDE